jgi:hypothetical protein
LYRPQSASTERLRRLAVREGAPSGAASAVIPDESARHGYRAEDRAAAEQVIAAVGN